METKPIIIWEDPPMPCGLRGSPSYGSVEYFDPSESKNGKTTWSTIIRCVEVYCEHILR